MIIPAVTLKSVFKSWVFDLIEVQSVLMVVHYVQLMYKNKTINNKQFACMYVCVCAAEGTDFTTTTRVSLHTKHLLGVDFVVYDNS